MSGGPSGKRLLRAVWGKPPPHPWTTSQATCGLCTQHDVQANNGCVQPSRVHALSHTSGEKLDMTSQTWHSLATIAKLHCFYWGSTHATLSLVDFFFKYILEQTSQQNCCHRLVHTNVISTTSCFSMLNSLSFCFPITSLKKPPVYP